MDKDSHMFKKFFEWYTKNSAKPSAEHESDDESEENSTHPAGGAPNSPNPSLDLEHQNEDLPVAQVAAASNAVAAESEAESTVYSAADYLSTGGKGKKSSEAAKIFHVCTELQGCMDDAWLPKKIIIDV